REDAGLKAGIGLLRESSLGQKPDEHVLRMVQDQLREAVGRLDYEVVLLAAANDTPIAGFIGTELTSLSVEFANFDLFPLISIRGEMYQATALPINMGSENLGTLILGKRFDLKSGGAADRSVLLNDGKVLLTNFDARSAGELAGPIPSRCS